MTIHGREPHSQAQGHGWNAGVGSVNVSSEPETNRGQLRIWRLYRVMGK